MATYTLTLDTDSDTLILETSDLTPTLTIDDTVTELSPNAVKSSGIFTFGEGLIDTHESTYDHDNIPTADEKASFGLYSRGVVTLPTLTDNTGELIIGSDGVINFGRNAEGSGGFVQVGNITGSALSLTDSVINYVYADYNSGVPIYAATLDKTTYLTDARLCPICRVYKESDELHIITYDEYGVSLAEKLLYKDIAINGFQRVSGLALSTAATRISTILNGVVEFGVQTYALASNIAGSAGELYEYYLVSGAWNSNTVNEYDSLYYSDGTDRQTLAANKYVAKYFYMGVEDDNHAYYIHGNYYNTATAALSEVVPTPPLVISSHAIYVGKIVIKQGATNGTAYTRLWNEAVQSAPATSHGDLTGRDDPDQHIITSITDLAPLTEQTFTGAIALNLLLGAYYLDYTMVGALELTVASGAVIGGYASGIIIGDGTNTPSLTGIVLDPDSSDFNASSGIKNKFTIGKFQDAVYISYTEVL